MEDDVKCMVSKVRSISYQGVMEYRTVGKAFTPRERRVTVELNPFHSILNTAVLNIIKQYYVGRIRMRVVAKQVLVKRASLAQNKLLLEKHFKITIYNENCWEQFTVFWRINNLEGKIKCLSSVMLLTYCTLIYSKLVMKQYNQSPASLFANEPVMDFIQKHLSLNLLGIYYSIKKTNSD